MDKQSKVRCKEFRRRILEISRQVSAVHIGSAFSCLEIVETIYYSLSDLTKSDPKDIFILSKGHGCLSQYVVLEGLGILGNGHIANYCTKDGVLGVHPDRGNPGIIASTGSLGHGLAMAVGMAYALREKKNSGRVHCVISDGELQEGSTWEAVLLAGALKLSNLICYIDNNDLQSLERTSSTHPNLYPITEKFASFGWVAQLVDGHISSEIIKVARNNSESKPLAIVCKTVKGKGISFMENVPIWHYRSPNDVEYQLALKELAL